MERGMLLGFLAPTKFVSRFSPPILGVMRWSRGLLEEVIERGEPKSDKKESPTGRANYWAWISGVRTSPM